MSAGGSRLARKVSVKIPGNYLKTVLPAGDPTGDDIESGLAIGSGANAEVKESVNL